MANIAGQALSTYSPELDQLNLCDAKNLGSSNITKLAECCPELRLVNFSFCVGLNHAARL